MCRIILLILVSMVSFGYVMEFVGKVVNWFIVIFVGFGIGGFFIYKNVVEVFLN